MDIEPDLEDDWTHWGTKLPILKNKMGRGFNIRLG